MILTFFVQIGLPSSDSVAAFYYPWRIVVPRFNVSPETSFRLVFLGAELRPGDNQPRGNTCIWLYTLAAADAALGKQ
jgi:hypothetical protein